MLLFFLKMIKFHWLEYALALGVLVVILSFIGVQQGIHGITEREIHAKAHNLGKNMLILPSELPLRAYFEKDFNGTGLPEGLATLIQNSKWGDKVKSSQAVVFTEIQKGNKRFPVMGIRDYTPTGAYPFPEKAIFMGLNSSKEFGLQKGQSVVIPGLEKERNLMGILKRPPEGLDNGLFVSLEDAQSLSGVNGKINGLWLSGCWCSIDVPQLAQNIETLVPGIKAYTIKGMLKAQKETVASVKKFSKYAWVTALAFIVITILFLGMFLLKRERVEIGILGALGIDPSWSFGFLVGTSGLLGILGGLLSYLAIPLITHWANQWLGLNLVSTRYPPVIHVLGPAFLCMLSAILPAFLSTKVEPTQILEEV